MIFIFAVEFIQIWYNQIENSSREELCDFFKEQFGLEIYLLKLLPKERVMISKLRCSSVPVTNDVVGSTPAQGELSNIM
jgi:hypothetical protein